ncbi:glycosyltransferase family A protein [Clostridium sartagoforme]|uniref:glycosyltransferase family 2 protein n=1 Tax=Clostridium sartagoforme TaxID=84031 RepID=UPI000A036CB5
MEDLVKRNKILTKYYYEENIGIVNARNRCLTEVKKLEFDYLISLDDDEKVEKNWLVKYYECLNKYEADVICGPVITEYKDLNNFISKSKIYTREILDTGTEITTCGCGNVLIKKAVIDLNIKFNIRYNTSGGEDTEYFKRIYELGKKLYIVKMRLYMKS